MTKQRKLTVMEEAVLAVNRFGIEPMSIANELGVAPLDLEEWLENFYDLYYTMYPEEEK